MRKRRKGRIYVKDSTNGRLYGDFRDLNNHCEALMQDGRATTDWDVAGILVAKRVKELEEQKRGMGIVGRGREETLEHYALHHLEKKKASKGEQRQLERAVEFFGPKKTLSAIDVMDIENWVEDLRENHKGRRGNAVISDGTIRHHLNSLSSLYKRAGIEKKVAIGFNPVAACPDKPRGKAAKADWLEVHEGALLLEAAKLYKPERSDVALADLHAIVATFLLTGGRFAEVMGLAVADISFARKTVTFRPHEWRRLKTDDAERTVPLWPQLEQILTGYLKGPNHPTGALLFPSLHRRVRGGKEEMLGDIRKALDAIAVQAGWAAGEIRSKMFRHTYATARLQSLDNGAPVSTWAVAKELGHTTSAMIEKVYGHLGTVRHRSEFVEYRPEIVEQIDDIEIRREFKDRFEKVARHLKLVA